MRDVTQAKKVAYYEATNRVINAKTAKKTDLMLCVKESQMQFA
jgi:thiamine pyrophosphokinase